MYFRCTSCLNATWIGSDRPPVAADAVTCQDCGRSYEAHPASDLGTTEASHYRHTASFAGRERLDMATAYSFLLGLISREELTAVEGLEVEEPALGEAELQLLDNLEMEEPAPEDRAEAPVQDQPPTIDPGFKKAVARGRLTVEEALRRGDRAAYATNLSRRYDLTMELALAVADNRVTLFQARRHSQEDKPPPVRVRDVAPAGGRTGMRLAVIGVVTVAILGLAWGLSRKEPQPRTRTASTRVKPSPGPDSSATPSSARSTPANSNYSSTEILTNDRGFPIKIVGLDPRTVLLAYCGAEADSTTCEALEIMDTVPPQREVRLGTFRHPDSPDVVRAIVIQRDRFSRRWVAGDGRQPIMWADLPAPPSDDANVADAQP